MCVGCGWVEGRFESDVWCRNERSTDLSIFNMDWCTTRRTILLFPPLLSITSLLQSNVVIYWKSSSLTLIKRMLSWTRVHDDGQYERPDLCWFFTSDMSVVWESMRQMTQKLWQKNCMKRPKGKCVYSSLESGWSLTCLNSQSMNQLYFDYWFWWQGKPTLVYIDILGIWSSAVVTVRDDCVEDEEEEKSEKSKARSPSSRMYVTWNKERKRCVKRWSEGETDDEEGNMLSSNKVVKPVYPVHQADTDWWCYKKKQPSSSRFSRLNLSCSNASSFPPDPSCLLCVCIGLLRGARADERKIRFTIQFSLFFVGKSKQSPLLLQHPDTHTQREGQE